MIAMRPIQANTPRSPGRNGGNARVHALGASSPPYTGCPYRRTNRLRSASLLFAGSVLLADLLRLSRSLRKYGGQLLPGRGDPPESRSAAVAVDLRVQSF